MERITKPVLGILASKRFAALIFALLAVTSVIGIIIPQGEPVAFYIDKYGEQLTILIKIFDLDCTYSSIRIKSLIFLLIVCLITCSLYCLPGILRVIKRNKPAALITKLLCHPKRTPLDSDTKGEK